MPAVVDLSVTPMAEDLLACLTDALSVVPKPPATISLRTGVQVELLLSTSHDECCAGTAWVRVVSIYPSSQVFPQADVGPSRCGTLQWAVVFEMGVARCAPTPDETSIPSENDWNTLAGEIMDDAAAMRRAICCLESLHSDVLMVPGAWLPLPTEGGCAGGLQTITVAVGPCDCPDE